MVARAPPHPAQNRVEARLRTGGLAAADNT
jgi:hypothetical protein